MNRCVLASSLIIFFVFSVLSAGRLLSTMINVGVVEPVISASPPQHNIYSSPPLYARIVSYAISGSTITSVSVTIYNSGTRPAKTVITVTVYDNHGKIIASGSFQTPAIPAGQSRTYSVPLSPRPDLRDIGWVEVSLGGAF